MPVLAEVMASVVVAACSALVWRLSIVEDSSIEELGSASVEGSLVAARSAVVV